jgi:hypothetical protein
MTVANADQVATLFLKDNFIFSSAQGASGSVPNSSLHLNAAASHERNPTAISSGKAGFQQLTEMRHFPGLSSKSIAKSAHSQLRPGRSGQVLTRYCDFGHCVEVLETAITVSSMPCW